MTGAHLVAKKLALIETYLQELRTHGRPEYVGTDIREQRFIEHTLQVTIQAALDQAALDVAGHIVSDRRLGEPATNRALFDLLAGDGWIADGLADRLRRMVGFRNILVHGYASVDPAIVRDVAENHLVDLDAYVTAIRSEMARRGSAGA